MDEINRFYSLKRDYDKQNNIIKSKILHNKQLDLRAKKTAWKSHKRHCINCKKPVGTFFSMKNKRLIARCGALNSTLKEVPCDLNIDITLDNYTSTSDLFTKYSSVKNTLENEINLKKLDIIHNYDDEETILNEFDKLKRKYLKNRKNTLNLVKKVDETLSKTEKEQKLTDKINSYLKESRQLNMEDDDKTDTISAYYLDIKRTSDKLHKLKYKNYYVDNNNSLVKEHQSIYNTSVLQ